MAEVLCALDLPAAAHVDQRVPKKLLVENGAPTAADKRRINDGIEEIRWLAALKPTTVGVPEYHDPAREYLEIAVLTLSLRPEGHTERLGELLHRAIPYPVFLIITDASGVSVSLAHKRWSQGEIGQTVLDGNAVGAAVHDAPVPGVDRAFLDALSIASQPRTSLHALYQGWIDTLLALQAARVTGTFSKATSVEQAEARRGALLDCQCLNAQIAAIRSTAAKETQIPRKVALNLELKRLQAEHAAASAKL